MCVFNFSNDMFRYSMRSHWKLCQCQLLHKLIHTIWCSHRYNTNVTNNYNLAIENIMDTVNSCSFSDPSLKVQVKLRRSFIVVVAEVLVTCLWTYINDGIELTVLGVGIVKEVLWEVGCGDEWRCELGWTGLG